MLFRAENVCAVSSLAEAPQPRAEINGHTTRDIIDQTVKLILKHVGEPLGVMILARELSASGFTC